MIQDKHKSRFKLKTKNKHCFKENLSACTYYVMSAAERASNPHSALNVLLPASRVNNVAERSKYMKLSKMEPNFFVFSVRNKNTKCVKYETSF